MSGFVVVVRHEDEADARADAARLVERGIGATVVQAPPPVEPSEPLGRADADGEVSGEGTADEGGEVSGEGTGDEAGEVSGADAGGEVSGEGTGDEGGEPSEPAAAGRWCVEVLPEDHARACELLGLEPPEPDPEEKPPIATWKIILAIWLVAMIVLPLAAFWLTVNLTD